MKRNKMLDRLEREKIKLEYKIAKLTNPSVDPKPFFAKFENHGYKPSRKYIMDWFEDRIEYEEMMHPIHERDVDFRLHRVISTGIHRIYCDVKKEPGCASLAHVEVIGKIREFIEGLYADGKTEIN